MSIVLMPFSTQLLGSTDRSDVTTYLLYIGTMTITCGSMVLQIAIIRRHPDIQAEISRRTLSLQPAIIITALMIAALIIAITIPPIGLWSLALMPLTLQSSGSSSVESGHERLRRLAAITFLGFIIFIWAIKKTLKKPPAE